MSIRGQERGRYFESANLGPPEYNCKCFQMSFVEVMCPLKKK